MLGVLTFPKPLRSLLVSRHPELSHWQATLASRFPRLPRPFVVGLALWSLGMILARRCGLSSVALHLARRLAHKENSLRQRLKEFYREAPAKGGAQRGVRRADFAATDCFAPLLAWVLSLWRGSDLVVALDVTNLGERFHVLCASVVVRGLGIPVAWKILPGNAPGSWNDHWLDLLGRLRAALGPAWRVLVLTDRGLESAALFGAIAGHGWHPLMRVKGGGVFRPAGWHKFYRLKQFAARAGCRRFAAAGQAYKDEQARLDCVLLACWQEGHEQAWLLLTDLPVSACRACWYGYRSWIEQQFKVAKSEGWQWQRTRMSDAGRAERLWLALAVATLWVVAVGVAQEVQGEQERWLARLEAALAGRRRARQRGAAKQGRRRMHRVFALGLAQVVHAWSRGEHPLPERLTPEPWQEPDHEQTTLTETEFTQSLNYP
jgi:hypothetical protein